MGVPEVPEDGDVVVRPAQRNVKAPRYGLRVVPGPEDQVLAKTRDVAIAQAVSFAKNHGVRAWLANGHRFILLKDFR
jgi:hypothetical protein